jgi:two-component system NtrC family sensor kinase
MPQSIMDRGIGANDASDPAKVDHLTVVSVAKRQWEKTFDAISDPLMIVDDGYVIRRANLALADDLGMAIQRIVGRKCHEVRRRSTQAFAGEPDAPCTGCPVPEARREGAPRDGEMPSRAGRLYRLRAYPFNDAGTSDVGDGWAASAPGGAAAPAPGRDLSSLLVVCSYRDVTDEREMARQLSNAERLAAIGRLAGGVAHEINNPLGGILAFAQILLRDQCPPDEQREYLREIEKSAVRCKAIVEALLRFSRQSPSAPRVPLSINDVVRESLTLVSYKYAASDVVIRCYLEDGLPPVLGNASQLEQVLVNLLSNAFDAITRTAGAAGTVPVPAQARGAIEVRTSMVGGSLELEVADTGLGIDDADLTKIFDPFFTTKEEGRGSGLGLAVSYAIVREHGGRIAARNRPGGGALFVVTLPIAD